LPPRCKKCNGVLKHDGVYFREPIPGDVYHQSLEAVWKCDLTLICGTSAVVYPFAELPRVAREHRIEKEKKSDSGLYLVERARAVTIIEINAEPTSLTAEGISDYLIQGKTGDVLPKIVEEVKRIRR
jgi:NAD-dependent deacetylase